MITLKKIIHLFTILFISVAVLSCSGKKSTSEGTETVGVSDSVNFIAIADADNFEADWSKQNIIVYHTIGEPDNLHPTNGTSSMRTEIFQHTQMSLIRLDFRKLDVAPSLLKELPVMNDDGVSYNCELRSEIKWDDGEPVTSADIIFTAMANKCPLTDNPHAKPYWNNLKEVIPDPSDPLKFTVVMNSAYMHNVIFWGDWPILQKKFYDPNNELGNYSFTQFGDTTFKADTHPGIVTWANDFNSSKFGREPNFLSGLGMYKVTAWDPGQSVTLTRKENHWTKSSTSIYETSYPEKIIFRVNKDPNSQMLDLKAQVMDGSNLVPTKVLLELQTDSNFNRNFHSRFTDSFNYTYIGMNMRPDGVKRKKLFDNKDVRKAMAYLTPIDDLNMVINKGINKRMIGPVSFLKKDFDTTLKAIPYDLNKGIELLTKAGWTDSDGDQVLDKMIDGKKVNFEFTINYMTNTPDWKDYATMLAEAYSKAGLKVNMNPLDFSVFVTNNKTHDFDMIISAWGQSAMPEDFTQLWHTSSWINEGSNYPGFGNDVSDALIDSIKVITDPELRRPLVHRFQQIVYDEQPMIFLFSSVRRNIIHKRFGNVEMYFERPGILLNNLKLLSSTDDITP